jgi:hypothetical protein
MKLRNKDDIRKLLPPEIDRQLIYEQDPENSIIRVMATDFVSDFGKLNKILEDLGGHYRESTRYLMLYEVPYSPSAEEKAECLRRSLASAEDNKKVLLHACEKFVNDLVKFRNFLLTEEDFKCTIYAEILQAFHTLREMNYCIQTEAWYPGIGPHPWHEPEQAHAHIALGERKEVAVVLKFSKQWIRPGDYDFRYACEKLKNCLNKGAKVAYFVYLHHLDKEDISKKFKISDFGLSGQWKTVPFEDGVIDNFLVATVDDVKKVF